MSKEFKGKRVVVTGAGAGIGKCICQQLARGGAEIIALSLFQSELDELKKEIAGIRTIQVDLIDWEAARKALANIGPVHGLVNNAGVAPVQPFLSITSEVIDKTYNLNVKAIINVSQIIVKSMLENGIKGSIVNIASVAGKKGHPYLVVYGGSKGAVIITTKAMAVELGPNNIRVNCVCPTLVKTELSRALWENAAEVENIINLTPLKRLATVQDAAEAAVFLLSDRASMITGLDMTVDGGLCA